MKLGKGQVAVVTGGASGIGFAMARRFAADGLAVVIQRPGASQLDQLMRFGITTGMDPSEVADKVFAAVRDGRFWVLPHDGSGERVRDVAARSYGDRNPELTPIAQPAGAGPSPVGVGGAAGRTGQ